MAAAQVGFGFDLDVRVGVLDDSDSVGDPDDVVGCSGLAADPSRVTVLADLPSGHRLGEGHAEGELAEAGRAQPVIPGEGRCLFGYRTGAGLVDLGRTCWRSRLPAGPERQEPLPVAERGGKQPIRVIGPFVSR